jgi:hypothetical protein
MVGLMLIGLLGAIVAVVGTPAVLFYLMLETCEHHAQSAHGEMAPLSVR